MDNRGFRSTGIDQRLLEGKVFISTRPAGKSQIIERLLGEQGARVIEMPMIRIEKASLDAGQQDIIKKAGSYDWLVFTSSNGVAAFFEHLKELTGSYNPGGNVKIAVIGSHTGSELAEYGQSAGFTGQISTGEGFADELTRLFDKDHPEVLIPVGNLARNTVEEGIKKIAGVTRINVYNTIMPESINGDYMQLIKDDAYEMIIFTSGSGFMNFIRAAGKWADPSRLRTACIGSVTEEVMVREGVTPLVTATRMDSRGIAEAVINYYLTNSKITG